MVDLHKYFSLVPNIDTVDKKTNVCYAAIANILNVQWKMNFWKVLS